MSTIIDILIIVNPAVLQLLAMLVTEFVFTPFAEERSAND